MSDRTPPAVHLHIGGERLADGSGGAFDHIDPATGTVNARIPLADARDVDNAVATAHAAYDSWRRTPPPIRRACLTRLAELIEANADEFARRGAMDNGMPVAMAGAGVAISAEWTRYYAGWADKIAGEVTGQPLYDGELGYTLRQPFGVIGVVITWNGPLISLAMKVPAAIAAGNTVVVKPSEMTPFVPELFMDLVDEAGIPPGVINMLPGTAEAGNHLVTHELVKKVTFTGGPATATRILEACAPSMKPVVLELGGKSANIVLEDADIATACQHAAFLSVGMMTGQGCAFPTRLLVQASVYDQVVDSVVAAAGSIVTGDPFNPTTIAGPVVNEAAVDRIMGMIDRAESDGARLVYGGNRVDRDGYFIEPTVFADVDPASELAQTEVFGPVLAITKFGTDDEAIEIANSTEYGLSGYIQTRDLKRAIRIAAELDTGEVLINGAANLAVHRPFGGKGISGVGKEGGRAGIDEFLQTKSVGVGLA
ncbi:aldehyde dehydrogenase family protein [Gordonia liuliyuniae]|uniref:Aldehyde dehydrogenase family protein n=1 Tax=Gordonia liuliyuniae TaxID=2911517 RepID=A0ABS9IP25_9ACTN|nr:aldehyde dehydrogenase family protein [Gordonia liuliyuniae]MCF8587309.1 aldehyde dehydrogenase family protein [Gordonia liuliyuniae]